MRTGSDTVAEIPVFFVAIIDPKMPPEMFEALLPKNKARQDEILYRMLFKVKYNQLTINLSLTEKLLNYRLTIA